MVLKATILCILFIYVYGDNQTITIIRTQQGQVYPFMHPPNQPFCNVQSSRIQFKNDQVYMIQRDKPFLVSIQPKDHMSSIQLTGMSRSIWNNQTKKYQANIITQTMCGSAKISTSVSFKAKIIFNADQIDTKIQNSTIQNEQELLVQGIIFCASMMEIKILGAAINQLMLISFLFINMLVEVPIITRFSYGLRTLFLSLFLVAMLLPSIVANILLLIFFIILGIFGVSRDVFVSMALVKKRLFKLVWYFLIFMQINYISFEILQVKNSFLLYVFDYCAFQIAFSIVFMLLYVTRLRGVVYLVFLAYFAKFLPQINSFQIVTPTIFNVNCKVNNLIMFVLLAPVLSYMYKAKDAIIMFSVFIFCISLNQSLPFQIKYGIIVVIFIVWFIAQMKIKGAFQTIKFRR